MECAGAEVGVLGSGSRDWTWHQRRSGWLVHGWYMPVSVVDENKQGGSGVRVVVRMRRVAVGRTAGSYKPVGSGDQRKI